MVDDLVRGTARIGLKEVKGHDHQGSHAAKPVENVVMGLRVGEEGGMIAWVFMK